jgi:hypothetical protein
LKDILVDFDNAPAQNSRLYSEKIKFTKAQRVPHPPDVPDLASMDFFLFRYLAEKLQGTSFTWSDDLIWAAEQIFFELLKIGLSNVFPNWITRLV